MTHLRAHHRTTSENVGEWLPEPIITGGHNDPAQHAETADSLSLAMLVLLESLSPEQRAVLLLHDVFDYGYPEITAIVGKSEDNVRQLATRARRHVEQRRPRFQTTREQHDELARRFFAAAEQEESPSTSQPKLRHTTRWDLPPPSALARGWHLTAASVRANQARPSAPQLCRLSRG
jgi:hypothetical protein